MCVKESERASASVGVGVCGDLARAREIVRSSSEWDRRGEFFLVGFLLGANFGASIAAEQHDSSELGGEGHE